MVEVFKTSVEHSRDAESLLIALNCCMPGARINFDLPDCDHVLRVEADSVCVATVVTLLESQGFTCCVMV